MKSIPTVPLTDVQREIMEIIWERREATVGDVLKVLAARRQVARNTVQTLMTRLEDKGWLRHREEGRTFVYSAARTKQRSLGAKVAQLVDRFFAGAAEEMVTALIEYRGLTDAEADRIRKMLDGSQARTNDEARISKTEKPLGNKKRRS